ncbi:hypothetical protein R4P70_32230 [Rhodococcus sp. IEGM 1241]|uniref:hypothetical protein n=1 Tax=Rhodococcus sp. IEGM 1241 TaxID=3082228 RepID=UPI0029543378|nr:hypothetical protein [Rhodococcus sp. IEGM 1241]MDV8015982.1 hypothetical protein [Rhodococcus sp. IEGM 1241]
MNDSVSRSSGRGDRFSAIIRLVEKADAELIANTVFGPADRYAQQAVELSLLPEGKARHKYVNRFYWYGKIDIHTGNPVPRDKKVTVWALGKDELGFWYEIKNAYVFGTAERHREQALADPLRRHFWAVISVASSIVQEIRALHDIAVEAFLTSATGPVDVDKELASITTHLLDVASVRVDIGSEPIGDTPEIQHARKLWLRHIEELDTNVVQPVMERITSLSEYRDRLRAVQIQTQTIRRIGKSAGIDERMDKLVAKSGRDVEGSSNIKSSTDEIHQAEVARSSALAEVRGDYLNALLP